MEDGGGEGIMLLWAQGTPRNATNCRWPLAAGKEAGSGFPSEPPEGPNPPGTMTLDSGPQISETMTVSCSKLPGVWGFVMAAAGYSHSCWAHS